MACIRKAFWHPTELHPGWTLRVPALLALLVLVSGCSALRHHEPAPRAIAAFTVCSAQDGPRPVVVFDLAEDRLGHPDWLRQLRLYLEVTDVILRPGVLPTNGTEPLLCQLDVVIEDRPGPNAAERLIGGFLGGVFRSTFAVVAVPTVAATGGPDAAEGVIDALSEASRDRAVTRRVLVKVRVTRADGQSADFERDGQGTAYYNPAAAVDTITALRNAARTRARENAVERAIVGISSDMIRDPRIFGLPRAEVEP